jgi:hypothetical protein
MQHASDVLNVRGNALFTHSLHHSLATSSGNFTAGTLHIGGDFTQANNGSTLGLSFVSTGTTVVFDGYSLQNISFASGAATTSRFANVEINNPAGVRFTTPAVTSGTITSLAGVVDAYTANTIAIGGDLVDASNNRWQVGTTQFYGTGVLHVPSLIHSDVQISGNRLLANTATLLANANGATGSLSVLANGVFDLYGQTLDVYGNLTVTNSNTTGDGLLMQHANDVLNVRGNALFTHSVNHSLANSSGNFTAGTLHIGGDFTQANNGSTLGLSFVSTGTTVVFDGYTVQNISFASPALNTSRFSHVEIRNPAGVNLLSNAVVDGQLSLLNGGVLNQANNLNLYYTNNMPSIAGGMYQVANTRIAGALRMNAPLSFILPSNNLFVDAGYNLDLYGQTLDVYGNLTGRRWLVDAACQRCTQCTW